MGGSSEQGRGSGESEGSGLHDQPAVVRSHLPLCPPPVVKAEPGELPDEELQGERVGSWGQEPWWCWGGSLEVRAEERGAWVGSEQNWGRTRG